MAKENGQDVGRERELIFSARISNLSKRVKAYIHRDEVKNFSDGSGVDIGEAVGHLYSVLPKYREQAEVICGNKEGYSLAFVWRDEGIPAIDFFRYSGLSNTEEGPGWLKNPEVHNFVFKNGIYLPLTAISCGEGLMVLGAEERFRRKTKSLEGYLGTRLEIPGLKLVFDSVE